MLHGRVVEEGRHDELLALGREYARLYCLQFQCGNAVLA
jgi:ATP-binding cassette subfamily B protein